MERIVSARIIPTQGIHNFRDYGGYASRFGGHVRQGLLFRSGQHCDATAEDLAHVSRLGLQTIIDLRSDAERELYPCARAQDHQAEVVFTPGNPLGLGSHVDAGAGVRTAPEAHRAMVDLYRHMPFRPILTQTIRSFFDRLSARAAPSLVHCLAGKDRTGLAVALVHHQLGVHRDDIIADYLLTNSVGNAQDRIAAGAQAVRSNFGQDMDDAAVATLMSVHADYLDTAFDAIGDIDAYCAEVLHITPAQQEALRLAYLG
jgi:protein tyrosine/serine phosphatase